MEMKDIIRQRRVELGLTQKEVADYVGVSEATLSRWESGEIQDFKRNRITALAKILKVSPSLIVGKTDDMEERFGSVYAIRCKENGKLYIGSTIRLNQRIYQHFRELKAHAKTRVSNVNRITSYVNWQSDYDKYGEEAFEVYCIESNIPEIDLKKREFYWIEEYKTRNPNYGYNSNGLVKASYEIINELPPRR